MGTGNDDKQKLKGPSNAERAAAAVEYVKETQGAITATQDPDTEAEVAAERARVGVVGEAGGDPRGIDPRLKDAQQLPPKSGLYHSILKSDNIVGSTGGVNYIKAQNERVMTSMGAWIVLGTDRPNSLRSGYGAWGADKAASIDLVVGRQASAREGKGPKSPSWINNDFAADAARIYISQLADIDRYFGLARGVSPQSVARSAVAIKADAVRLIGREGVKIVTGGSQGVEGWTSGEPTSHGGKIVQPAPAIELIAGNKITNRKFLRIDPPRRELVPGLQGIALGYNTRDAMRELADIVDSTIGACNNVAEILVSVVTALGVKHPIALGAVSAQAALRTIVQGNASMYHLRGKLNIWRYNHLTPFGYKCIWSRNVKTN
jgi:hypothetical protein|tara:strand:+ start:3003 stop:4133 length:1131 start_codon:yes stop_codon:yes gene_type:complete